MAVPSNECRCSSFNPLKGDEDLNNILNLSGRKHRTSVEETSTSQVGESKSLVKGQQRGVEHIKQGVVDYVASLLMPLYKARKIDKDGYKSIMKKSATKVNLYSCINMYMYISCIYMYTCI